METETMPFSGTKLRVLREKRGMSQVELAKASHIFKQQINLYEANVSDPTSRSLERLAAALNVKIDALFTPESELAKGARK